jgi:hypothetical protein
MIRLGDVAWLFFADGKSGIIMDDPRECPYCHRMTAFFESVGGETRCTGCEVERVVA